jgi:hypothetical protein
MPQSDRWNLLSGDELVSERSRDAEQLRRFADRHGEPRLGDTIGGRRVLSSQVVIVPTSVGFIAASFRVDRFPSTCPGTGRSFGRGIPPSAEGMVKASWQGDPVGLHGFSLARSRWFAAYPGRYSDGHYSDSPKPTSQPTSFEKPSRAYQANLPRSILDVKNRNHLAFHDSTLTVLSLTE